jgi:hypothetical protein
LEHQDGEKRAVVARVAEFVRYRSGTTVGECPEADWQDWAKQTSIVNIGD